MNLDARKVNTIWVAVLLITAMLLPLSALGDEVDDIIGRRRNAAATITATQADFICLEVEKGVLQERISPDSIVAIARSYDKRDRNLSE